VQSRCKRPIIAKPLLVNMSDQQPVRREAATLEAFVIMPPRARHWQTANKLRITRRCLVAVRTKRPTTALVPRASEVSAASLCVLYIGGRKIFSVFTRRAV